MRVAHYLVVGLLATMLATSAAADDQAAPRNFGTSNCPQKFFCASLSVNDLASMANDCSVHGLGISPTPDLFDGASLDSNNCMTANLPTTGSRPAVSQCCVIPSGDTCIMRCKLLVN